jgi:hypothetical protein
MMIATQANNFSAYAYATACAQTEEANAQTIKTQDQVLSTLVNLR